MPRQGAGRWASAPLYPLLTVGVEQVFRTGLHRIEPVTAGNEVDALAVDPDFVIAITTLDAIVAGTSNDRVVTVTALDIVVAGAPVDDVVATEAVHHVVSS